jgi:hypothetical protein
VLSAYFSLQTNEKRQLDGKSIAKMWIWGFLLFVEALKKILFNKQKNSHNFSFAPIKMQHCLHTSCKLLSILILFVHKFLIVLS